MVCFLMNVDNHYVVLHFFVSWKWQVATIVPNTLERIKAHQLDCYRKIVKCDGSDANKKPHRGITKRQDAGGVVAN